MISSTLAFFASVALAISGLFSLHPLATLPATSQAAGTGFALPSGVTDTIAVTNASGAVQANYPYQFGRPFVQGEILHYPQVLVNGSAVQTQADVKNRYPDGSVKFAVISVIIPTIPTSGAVTLSFQDQSSGNNAALSTSDMLNSKYDFGAAIKLTSGGVTKTADARTMLGNGDYTYWASGPIATTIVLQDNSAARKYDLGFDSYRSIHPTFEATFWPSLNKVYVRVIGMDSNSTALEDVQANLAITLGNASPQTVYTNPGLITIAATGWTKDFWQGGAPEQKINIDNNIAYIAATKFIPNYDPALKPFITTTVQNRYDSWIARPRDLYQAGAWTVYMPTTGARGDIGIEPDWMSSWLYTGAWQDRAVALGQANLATAWDWNVIEGDASYKIDRAQTISGLGLPISDYAHPVEWLFDSRGSYYNTVLIHGTRITPPVVWTSQTAHHPDPFSVPYILTGDPFYLSELQNWAAATALKFPACQTKTINCGSIRQPSPAIAGITDEVRGDAWILRTRASAGLLSVDGTPQQQYFVDITDDAIAAWEGQRAIPDPVLSGTAAYQKTAKDFPVDSSPLHFFAPGTLDTDPNLTVHGASTYAESPWMDYYFIATLGYVRDMGYPAGNFLSWFGTFITEQFNEMPPNGTYDIGLIASYRMPASAGKGQPWFTNWEQVEAEFLPAVASSTIAQVAGSYYTKLAGAATAALSTEPGGARAWNWFVTNNYQGTTAAQKYFTDDTNWDILPRSISATPLPLPVFTPLPPTTQPATTTVPIVTPPVATSTLPVPAAAPLKNVAISGDFSQISTCTSATANSPCSITVVFRPTLAGVRSGALTFSDGATGKSYSISLAGTGVAPQVATTTTSNPPATTPPSVTTPSATPPVTTLIGTDGNDTLNLTTNIHTVDGKGGNDVAVLGSFAGADSNASWYTITKNADGSYTAVDVHATGYWVTLYNVEQLKWPNGSTLTLGGTNGSTSTTTTPPPVDPNPHKADILGTDANDTLTIVGNGHVVDGKDGYDIASINFGSNDMGLSWLRISKNVDGAYVVVDVHASGYRVTLYNVEELHLPAGPNVVLANAKLSVGFFDSVIAFLEDTKLNIQLAFQSAGRNLAILLSGGRSNLATATVAVSAPALSFGSVTLGQTASQVLTISFSSSGITAIASSTK